MTFSFEYIFTNIYSTFALSFPYFVNKYIMLLIWLTAYRI
jgi:hypothetical protein